jgi:hypothetical protein
MRKILLATTALAGTALFAAPAMAGMEVTVGGYNDFRAGFFDQNSPAGTPKRSNDFENEFQLEVEAKEKTSTGIEYGAVASLWNGNDTVAAANNPILGGNGSNRVRLHQAYGYVNGSWGQVRAGDEHGVSDFHVEAPMTYDFGAQVDGSYTEFVNQTTVFAILPHFLNDDENSTKLSYVTPKLGMNGHSIQAGVSYAPNLDEAGTSVSLTNPAANGQARYSDMLEVGAKYEGSFEKINAAVGFVLTTADGNNNTAWSGAGVGARGFTAYDIGAQLGYAGFTVGGNYANAGRYNTDATGFQNGDQKVWSVGATYKFDRASVGGSYLTGEGYNNQGFGGAVAASTSNRVDDYTAYGIGAGYSLFDGMTTSVDAVFFDQTRPAGVGNDNGHVVIVSNRVAF